MDTILRQNPGLLESETSALNASSTDDTIGAKIMKSATTGTNKDVIANSFSPWWMDKKSDKSVEAPFDLKNVTLSISLLSILKSVYILAFPIIEINLMGNWIITWESWALRTLTALHCSKYVYLLPELLMGYVLARDIAFSQFYYKKSDATKHRNEANYIGDSINNLNSGGCNSGLSLFATILKTAILIVLTVMFGQDINLHAFLIPIFLHEYYLLYSC
jgi:hypothetical protein